MKLKILPFLFFLNLNIFAQVGIGNTNPNGALEITSTNDGLIIPRIALTAANIATINTPTVSEIVYNTATAGSGLNAVTPGFYYWNGSKWLPFISSGSGSGWLLTGNAGTSAATNFLGTTDDVDMVFKRNNLKSGQIGTINTAFGYNASKTNNASGYPNSAYGVEALKNNANGGYNNAFGYRALETNGFGFYNCAFGDESLKNNNFGNFNSAFGFRALEKNDGYYNTAIGANALQETTSGQYNTGIGMNALISNKSGLNNTAVGYNGLNNNTTGNYNTAFGNAALTSNTDGSYNTAIGFNAFPAGSSYQFSSALGYNALVSASNQVRIGDATTSSIGGQVGWTTLSDGRFKKNIVNNVPGLEFITKLRPVTYNLDLENYAKFNNIPLKNRILSQEEKIMQISYTGFIAQEVEAAAKSVNYNFSGIDAPKNNTDYYGIRYAEFTVPLVKAVQEQQVIIETYKNKVNNLEKRLAELEKLLLSK
jgi:trimeric autotransporter adhesin